MIKRKYRVQKSYRIDKDNDDKIVLLAWYYNRPQNDIINYALEQLFNNDDIKSDLHIAEDLKKQYEDND